MRTGLRRNKQKASPPDRSIWVLWALLLLIAIMVILSLMSEEGPLNNGDDEQFSQVAQVGHQEADVVPRRLSQRPSRSRDVEAPQVTQPHPLLMGALRDRVIERARVNAAHAAEHAAAAHAAEHAREREAAAVARSRAEQAAPPETPPAPQGPPDGSIWHRLAQCESGGNPRAVNPSGKYRGAFQFDLRTWRSVGMSGDPINHSFAQQLAAAQRLQASRGWSPWPRCARKLGLL